MICDCGLMDMVLLRDRGWLHITLSEGVATVRPVDVSVRVEHLNCGKCQGILLRIPPGGYGMAGCGCSDRTAVRPSVGPNDTSASVFSRSGMCPCGAMTWEDARDGALILDGVGSYAVWDRDDGAVVMVGGLCLACGALEL